jgi:flagellar export protein FliJ
MSANVGKNVAGGLATVLRVKNRELDRAREHHQKAQSDVTSAKETLNAHQEAARKNAVTTRASVDDILLADRAHTRTLELIEVAKQVVAKAEEAHDASRKSLVTAMNVATSIASIVSERTAEAARESEKRDDKSADEISTSRFARRGAGPGSDGGRT